jgi:hypothetical protein
MSDLQPGAPHNEPHNEPRDPRALDDELMLAQVKAVLTPMPPVDRRHIAQILAATQERKRTPLQRLFGRLEEVLEWWRFNTPPVARGATLAAAALTIGFVGRGYVMNPGAASSNAASVRLASQESAASPATAPAVVRAVEGPVEPSEQRSTPAICPRHTPSHWWVTSTTGTSPPRRSPSRTARGWLPCPCFPVATCMRSW